MTCSKYQWIFFGCKSTRAHVIVEKEYKMLCQSSRKSGIFALNYETCGTKTNWQNLCEVKAITSLKENKTLPINQPAKCQIAWRARIEKMAQIPTIEPHRIVKDYSHYLEREQEFSFFFCFWDKEMLLINLKYLFIKKHIDEIVGTCILIWP